MIIYIVIVGILLFYLLLLILVEMRQGATTYGKNLGVQLQSNLYWPVAIAVFFVAALRDGIGYDFNAYQRLFSVLHNGSAGIIDTANFYNYEIGFVWLNRIVPDFKWLIIIIAVLGVGIKLVHICRWSDNRAITLLLYFTGIFLTFDMGVIRQGVAIALFLVILEYCENDRKLLAVGLIVVSCLFHISSLIYLPIVFIGKKKFTKKQIYIFTAIVSTIFFIDISDILVKLLSMTEITVLTSKLEYYSTIFTGNINGSYIKRVLFLVVFTEFFQRKGFVNDREVLCFNSYFLSVIFMALFSSIDILGGRGVTAYYFMQSYIFATMYKRASSLFWRVCIVVVCIVLGLYAMQSTIIYGNASGQVYSPYTTILSGGY